MSFQQGLSGLNAASRGLDVAGNNIANANTVGFKSGRPEFSDVFANSLTGAGTNSVGIGVQVAAITTQVTQGNISVTSNPFDLAVNGREDDARCRKIGVELHLRVERRRDLFGGMTADNPAGFETTDDASGAR